MSDEPWLLPPPDQGHGTEAYRRYARSLRLAQFQRDLAAWARVGKLGHPRYQEKIAYRRMCLSRWQDYLDGKIDPPTGRKVKR